MVRLRAADGGGLTGWAAVPEAERALEGRLWRGFALPEVWVAMTMAVRGGYAAVVVDVELD